MLQAIKSSLPAQSGPKTLLMDFEKAVVNAFAAEFPMARIQGCFFHLCQALMRRINDAGLKVRYETDSEFAHRLRHLAALAFVPVSDVIAAFEALCDAEIIPAEAQTVLDYFEDTWIGRPHRRGRRTPLFPIDMWNCNEAAADDMPKTNNAVEGWHNGFESTLDATHPNIFRLVEALQREQVLTDVKYEQVIAGEPPPKKKKVYRDNAVRLQELVRRYNATYDDDEESLDNRVLLYLRGIAHNIAY